MANDLLGRIPSNNEIASFTGDGAYGTQDVHKAFYLRGAIPIIPTRQGAKLAKGWLLLTAMKRSRRIGGWGGLSGNAGAGTTEGLW